MQRQGVSAFFLRGIFQYTSRTKSAKQHSRCVSICRFKHRTSRSDTASVPLSAVFTQKKELAFPQTFP